MTQSPNVQQICVDYVNRYQEVADSPIQQPAEIMVGTLEYQTAQGQHFSIRVVYDKQFKQQVEIMDQAIMTTFNLGMERLRPLAGPLPQGHDVVLNIFRIQHHAGSTNKSSSCIVGATNEGYYGLLLIHPHDAHDATLFHEVTHFAERMFFITDQEASEHDEIMTSPAVDENHPFVRGDFSLATWLDEFYGAYLSLPWESWVIDAVQAGFPQRGGQPRTRLQAMLVSHNVLEAYGDQLMGLAKTCEGYDPDAVMGHITRRDALRRIQQIYHKHVHPSDLAQIKRNLLKQHIRV